MIPTTTYSIPTTANVVLEVTTSLPAAVDLQPTLLFLHFWGGSSQTFSQLAEIMTPTHPLVIPSLRGWGKSTGGSPGHYRIVDHAEDIEALVASHVLRDIGFFKNGVVLVGHSMGGKIAQLLAVRDNLPALKRLVLLAPAPLEGFQLPRDMREQQKSAYNSREAAEFVMRNVLLGPGSKVASEDKATIDVLVEDCLVGDDGAKKAWPEYAMEEDYLRMLDSVQLKIPVAVVVGSADVVEPKDNVKRRVVRVLENAGASVSLRILNDVGHLLPVEAAKDISEVLLAE
ncbi:hypothetical protein HMN09_00293800 [Mycena chlorophos]|uniref:AB hydrolase-1 domain-containing protein n=1 Tax=Mycena chlorophos TaxID=658473 RepID=A0A8H6WI69_MYCCL|nr:hypothetical protein HMN09_00293800 [Mycena chlorophos]